MRFGVPFLFGAAFWLVLGTLVAVTLPRQGEEAVTAGLSLPGHQGRPSPWGLCHDCEPWRLSPGLIFCSPCPCSPVTRQSVSLWHLAPAVPSLSPRVVVPFRGRDLALVWGLLWGQPCHSGPCCLFRRVPWRLVLAASSQASPQAPRQPCRAVPCVMLSCRATTSGCVTCPAACSLSPAALTTGRYGGGEVAQGSPQSQGVTGPSVPLQSPAEEATYLNVPWAEFFHRTGIR